MFSPHHLLSEDGRKQLMSRLQMRCLLMGLYHAVCEAVQPSNCRQRAKGNNWSLFLFQLYHQCQVLLNTLTALQCSFAWPLPPSLSFPAPQRDQNPAPWPRGFNILLCCSFPLYLKSFSLWVRSWSDTTTSFEQKVNYSQNRSKLLQIKKREKLSLVISLNTSQSFILSVLLYLISSMVLWDSEF